MCFVYVPITDHMSKITDFVSGYMKKLTTFCFLAFIVILAGGVCGCTDQNKNIESGSSSADEDDNVAYDVNGYEERLRQKRIPVEGYAEQYTDDIKVVAGADYQKLHFSGTLFEDFPETDRLVLMTPSAEKISVEDTIAETENWLESIGKADEVNLSTELGIDLWGSEGELREGEDSIDLGAYSVPLFYNHMDELPSGDGAVIMRPDCYMCIDRIGMSQMSDGKACAYLRAKGAADSQATDILNMENVGDPVVSGSVRELSDVSYPLISGELSIGAGAELVDEYYSDLGTMEHPDGIRYEAAEAEVYPLEDVFFYRYRVQRNYYNVPIVYAAEGHYQFYSDYSLSGEGTKAYVVDNEGVTAFNGTPYNEGLIPLVAEDSLIGVAEAADILEEDLAAQINADISSVGLAYLPLVFQIEENSFETIIFPCWKFSGRNTVKDEQVNLYVDVLTGEIYYYGYTPFDQEFELEQ